jgi:hypothetical protein
MMTKVCTKRYVLANKRSNYSKGTKFDLPLTCFSNPIYNIPYNIPQQPLQEEVPGVKPLSFVDDTSFTARGNSIKELYKKLQKANEVAIDWGCCQNRGTTVYKKEGPRTPKADAKLES